MNELEQLQQENEALRLALQAQQEINHYKQFFLARIAHELRSPLSSLMGLQQLILNDLCDDPAEERAFLKDANVAANKLLTMIDDCVAVAKIDYGRITLDATAIEVTALFTELEQLVALPVGNRNFRLTFDAPASLPTINGDRQKIIWVLRNLIDRALDTTPERNGHIHLSGSRDGDPSQVTLTLQLPCGADEWQWTTPPQDTTAASTVTHLQKISDQVRLSPALTWQLVQTLIMKMGGSAAIGDQDPAQNKTPLTVICLTLPAVGLD
ncbi:MAG: sensor histidine kinase [Synechocystis sp.]